MKAHLVHRQQVSLKAARVHCSPSHQMQCLSCSGKPFPRIAVRSTSVQGCSRSPAPESCHWFRYWGGTQRRSVKLAHGTTSASPSCSRGWCSCLGPSLDHSWFGLHTILHCDYSPRHGVFHLAMKAKTIIHIPSYMYLQGPKSWYKEPEMTTKLV